MYYYLGNWKRVLSHRGCLRQSRFYLHYDPDLGQAALVIGAKIITQPIIFAKSRLAYGMIF